MPRRPRSASRCKASRDAFVYLSATRGFKSGGFNSAARGAWERPSGRSLPGATSWPGKPLSPGGRVRASTALFYSDYQDLQVQSFLRPGVPDISNAASATIRGIEFEMAAADLARYAAVRDRLLARGVCMTTTSPFCPGGRPLDATGNHLNNAPQWSGSGSAAYDFAICRRVDGRSAG